MYMNILNTKGHWHSVVLSLFYCSARVFIVLCLSRLNKHYLLTYLLKCI